MKLNLPSAEIFIPDALTVKEALVRTTHLCVAAHQDDIEIMAARPILECFQQSSKWFTGVIVTDGRGAPRKGAYETYTDDEMRLVRFREQRKAAFIGEYAALLMLDYPSKDVKDGLNSGPIEDIVAILKATHPQEVYTHNLADKHDTHVGVALKTIAAIRALPPEERPLKLFGCEVWRDLDWMLDEDKQALDLSTRENLQSALLGVFDSQISGGKRYDLASLGRRRANATYFESHETDEATSLTFAMDMTPLIVDCELSPAVFVQELIQRFAADVNARIARLTKPS